VKNKKMNNIKRFMKNRKAISPIFATLILIAIAVIAGVVVYMFTSGTLATMTGGGTAASEKVSVQGVQYTAAGTAGTGYTVQVYAESTSGPVPIPNGMIIKDSSGNTIETLTLGTTATMTTGSLTTITGTGATDILSAGSYTATLITQAGGNFVSPSFVVS
jgi:flagellin-like protein